MYIEKASPWYRRASLFGFQMDLLKGLGRILGEFWGGSWAHFGRSLEVLVGLGGSWPRVGRVLGASWGTFGGVSGAFWGALGSLGRVGRFLGASWGVSGRISVGKVANMAPTWLPKWSQDDQKIDPKIDHFFDAS